MNTQFDWTQIVSAYEASEVTGYSNTHIRLLCDTGMIDSRKIGGAWMIYLPSLLAYKKRQFDKRLSSA